MHAKRVSVSLSPTLMRFAEEYKFSHNHKSRSQVIEETLTLLRERELEAAYRDADTGPQLAKNFAPTVTDGLANEAW